MYILTNHLLVTYNGYYVYKLPSKLKNCIPPGPGSYNLFVVSEIRLTDYKFSTKLKSKRRNLKSLLSLFHGIVIFSSKAPLTPPIPPAVLRRRECELTEMRLELAATREEIAELTRTRLSPAASRPQSFTHGSRGTSAEKTGVC